MGAAPQPVARENRHAASRVVRVAVGAAALAAAGGGFLIGASNAIAASGAPTHGKTTCKIAGDECRNAIAYANRHDGGGARVLAVEADTESHGGAVKYRVFDIRIKTNRGVFVEHVYRWDGPPQSDHIWWQSRAENQGSGGRSSDSSPDTNAGNDQQSPDKSPVDKPAPSGNPGHNTKISYSQAAADAQAFATQRGYQVLGVKHNELNADGQKDYYQVKLQLGENGRKHGTTNIWVDATSSPGTVTAASGSGLSYRDSNSVSPSTAEHNAVAAVGGGTAYKYSLHGGKWRWYWVFVRDGSTKYKIGVDAVTGIVTQMKTT
ncbi:MAG: hypothetical protein ACYDGN_12020 [Acidimicrobiales bacterium]